MPELPDRLRRNGRAVDPVFDPPEKLFRRYRREHYVNGQFSGLGLRINIPPSTNREKYSAAEDVLFSANDEFAGWGVLSLRALDVTIGLPENLPSYDFSCKHVPLEDNYSHSEIWCDSIEPTGGHIEPDSRVKKLFRAMMGQRARIEIEATV